MSRVAIVLGLTILAALFGATHRSATAADVNVNMTAVSFSPANVTINVGDKVTWKNTDPLFHTTTSGTNCDPSGLWDSGLLGPSQTFSRVFNTAGTFPYFCIPHCLCCGMTGSVKVESPPCLLNCPAQDGGPTGGVGPANKSPDLDSNGQVSLVDLSIFAQAFNNNPFTPCADYDCNGTITLVDVSLFAQHFGHTGVAGVCQ